MPTTNITADKVEDQTLEQQHQHLREVHEHLQHAATSDAPEEIRERMRRAELALKRHDEQAASGK